MDTNSSNFKGLLQGRILVKEITSDSFTERTWIELKLAESDRQAYPLRVRPYAMLKGSKFQPSCLPERAAFRLRYATFLREDIDNGLDPNFDKVGDYIDIPSTSDLDGFLTKEGLSVEDFVDSGLTDYPM
ncbi:hypothetical protein ACQKRQ_06145 [Paraburkholderia sp. NPDC080076]|jgi:hypothetical protein|uniref:hypothetical protein n=1 Tax=Paraburkholderia sp. NPDC080076 TaxID=3390605 RepID=UPI003D00AA43